MKYNNELDTVFLARSLPEYGLCTGDLCAVVGVYDPDGVEVEFVTASGKTEAVLTLTEHDVSPIDYNDLKTVRPLRDCNEITDLFSFWMNGVIPISVKFVSLNID